MPTPPIHRPVCNSRGSTIFLTGLPAAGKTTIAGALERWFVARDLTVTMLDGDVVRTTLSSELGFSREDRDLNIRRVGFVAAEVTRHGGIAICACVAPYDEARRAVRRTIEQVGAFILVHVATRLDTCEARDPKGLYARARNGLLPHFTGVTDPYESPTDADVVIDTDKLSVDAAVLEIVNSLRERATGMVWP